MHWAWRSWCGAARSPPWNLLEEAIQRTERPSTGQLNAVVQKHYEEARAQPSSFRLAGEGPFTGVPFLLKDLYMMLEGTVYQPTAAPCTGNNVADHDSTLVQRYKPRWRCDIRQDQFTGVGT